MKSQTTVPPNAVRVIVVVNFILLALCVVPGTRSVMELIFRTLERYPPLPWFFDVWMVGSTIIATGLLAWRFVRGRKAGPVSLTQSEGMTLDSVLLLAWWLTLLGICMYAFMLGTGG